MSRMKRMVTRYIYASVLSRLVLGIGMLKRENWFKVSQMAELLGYRLKTKAPEVALSEIVPEQQPIELRVLETRDGNVSLYELASIVSIARQLQPRRIFEIGTFNGRTTLNLAANSAPDVSIVTLDLPAAQIGETKLSVESSEVKFIDKAASGVLYHATDQEHKIRQVYGDSATFDFSPYYGTCDLVFVDASHAYEYVLNDSRIALKLLKPSGPRAVIWHDYGAWEGVTDALNKLYSTGDPVFRNLKKIASTSLAYLGLD